MKCDLDDNNCDRLHGCAVNRRRVKREKTGGSRKVGVDDDGAEGASWRDMLKKNCGTLKLLVFTGPKETPEVK